MKFWGFRMRDGSPYWDDATELDGETPDDAVAKLCKLNRRGYTMMVVPVEAFTIVDASIEVDVKVSTKSRPMVDFDDAESAVDR